MTPSAELMRDLRRQLSALARSAGWDLVGALVFLLGTWALPPGMTEVTLATLFFGLALTAVAQIWLWCVGVLHTRRLSRVLREMRARGLPV